MIASEKEAALGYHIVFEEVFFVCEVLFVAAFSHSVNYVALALLAAKFQQNLLYVGFATHTIDGL